VTVALHASGLGHDLLLGDGVIVGADVTFGANVVVYEGTVIGDGCFVQDGAVLGKVPSLSPTSTAKRGELAPLMLGAGCVVSTGAVVYRGTTLGSGCILGDYAGVRERCTLGEKVVVGRGSVVENDTVIGDFTKIQTNVYITAYMTMKTAASSPRASDHQRQLHGPRKKRHKLIKGATIAAAPASAAAWCSAPASRSAKRRSSPPAPW
jgi:carbonic anhydrase/acetyltransferase-like protein (isoleucine patch superfamily)